ncbi:hypothetical protein FACS189474_4970 [Bacteroidia bacterium]|nr:hypothetical protein FACS189474_4970 [Bacteroidia bacterium]
MKTVQKGLLLSLVLWVAACGKKQPAEAPAFTQQFTQSIDIGHPAITGDFAFNDLTGVYTLSGSGDNIWYKADQLFFVYEPVEGDFSLSSKIVFAPALENSNMHRKIGLIIRESLETGAKYADVTVHFGDGLTSLQYRPATNVDTEENRLDILSADHLVLERKAGKILVHASCEEGNLDSTVVTSEIALDFPETCYVGLFICSHDSTVKETAYFSEVKLVK